MSLKNRDEHNRWRNKTVAFRVSPEEWEQIERYVQLSGLTKQDYITRRLINKEIVVQGNPRVYEPEYQLTEPPAMMSARTYKAKFVEPLIARLKSLLSTLFARYFKAVDSYHRLNITNGNLYRENEMLSKINSKLKSENENLRSEVKDYKLLRKVFGHKQIDELLEQARNIKGRKRENPRSR